MKEKVSLIIKILGIDVRELVIDLSTDFGIFNSIEWYEKELYFFNCRFIKYYNDNLQKLKSNKFYSNPDYIL